MPDPRNPDDTTRIDVLSLIVEDKVMFLRFAVTPDFDSVSDAEKIGLDDALGSGGLIPVSQIKLVDRKNLKEYSVIHEGMKWWGTPSSVTSVNGSPAYAYAVFAAPEDDIDVIDVRFNEQYAEVVDVPITRSES